MQLQHMRLHDMHIDKVIVANRFWSRLRGWYGYRNTGVNGVLLTNCNAVHTLAMHLRLDIIWLDCAYKCIRVQLDVQPWRLKWCRGARHVLELRSSQRSAQSRPPSRLIGHTLLRLTN